MPRAAGDDDNVAGIAQPLHIGGIAYGPDAEEQWGIPAGRWISST